MVAPTENTRCPSGSPSTSQSGGPTLGDRGYSLNALGRAILCKAAGLAASVQVIDSAAAPHDRLDNTGLVLDLKKPDVRPESIRAFAELNLRFLLAVREGLVGAPALLTTGRLHRGISGRVESSIEKLTRDLQVSLGRGGIVVLEPMSPHTIAAMAPMMRLPELHDAPQLATMGLIIEGSGIGAAIQAKRQARTFGLTGELNGGAEYLNSFGNPVGQIARVISALRQVNPLLKVPTAQASAQRTAVAIFEVLHHEFAIKTAELGL